jgi:hypothetical protein
MADGAIKYAVEVHKKFKNYWPTWLPGERLKVGDYGELQHGILFKRLGRLSDCGVSEEALKANPAAGHDDLLFRSKGKVRVKLQGSAGNAVPGLGIPVGEAGARLTFTHANSSFLAAVGVKAHTLRSEQRLRTELRTKVEEGSFQLEHVVVTDVLRADAGRVFISDSASQEVMLRAKTALGPEPIELVSAGAQMSVVHQSEDILAYGGKRGMTPLFRIMGFKHGRQARDYLRIFSRTRGVPRIRVKSIRTAPQVGSLIEISPLPSQRLVVAPTGAQPFWVERADVRPFRVEPTLIDPRTVELYFPPAARLLGAEEPGEQALVVGPLESEPSAGEELTMRPLGASPFVVEPLDGDPFLVNLPPGENLTFAPEDVEFLEGVVPAAVGEPTDVDEDPFGFDYVDFDAELADATGGSGIELE